MKGRRPMRRRNKKIAVLASSLILGMVLWSQMSVIGVVVKKYRKEYRRRLEKARQFVVLQSPKAKDLGPWPLDESEASSVDKASTTDTIISKGTVLGTVTSTGHMLKQYYKLENVQIGPGDITFFVEDDFKIPPEQLVDTVYNNGTNYRLPTKTMMSHAQISKQEYINWNYVRASKEQPSCKRWVDRPTYLVQTQHGSNIWHAWNEGVMSSFQSLREHGLLPLAEIDEDGNQKEYVDDLDEGCPWEIDESTQAQKRLASCRPKTGIVPEGKCQKEVIGSCRPGVYSYYRADGPLLWLAKDTGVAKKWSHMFYSMTENIRSWESLTNSCFKEIYIGKSNVLSYYMPLYINPFDEEIQFATRWRSNATHAFKLLMQSAQINATISKAKKKPEPLWKEPWPDYRDPEWFRLLKGITRDEMDALDVVLPNEDWARRAYMSPKEVKGLEKLWKESSKLTKSLASRSVKEYLENLKKPSDGGLPAKLESPRPVITYIWRDNYKRSVLNTHDILYYILSRFNVTLKVTTLQEPLPDVIDLMSHSDVILGMHGAGWTNGLFVKRGAGALQLIPYGWVSEDGKTIRGSPYKSLLLASDCIYCEWVNKRPDLAYMRRHDFKSLMLKGVHMKYSVHPLKEWGMPEGVRPGNHWIYQNTFVDMESFVPVLDSVLQNAGIPVIHQD